MLMKTIDRLFILGIALLLCLVGMRSMNNFSKNRNLNGINVIGQASAKIPVDTLNFHLEFIATGDTKVQRQELALQRVQDIKGLQEGLSIVQGYDTHLHDDNHCYRNEKESNSPCTRVNFTLKMKGAIQEQAPRFLEKLKSLPWVNVHRQRLIVEYTNPALLKLRKEAMNNALIQGQELAKNLGVKLGKLLVYSEKGFNSMDHEYGVSSRSIETPFPLDKYEIEVQVHAYHTYAIE